MFHEDLKANVICQHGRTTFLVHFLKKYKLTSEILLEKKIKFQSLRTRFHFKFNKISKNVKIEVDEPCSVTASSADQVRKEGIHAIENCAFHAECRRFHWPGKGIKIQNTSIRVNITRQEAFPIESCAPIGCRVFPKFPAEN